MDHLAAEAVSITVSSLQEKCWNRDIFVKRWKEHFNIPYAGSKATGSHRLLAWKLWVFECHGWASHTFWEEQSLTGSVGFSFRGITLLTLPASANSSLSLKFIGNTVWTQHITFHLSNNRGERGVLKLFEHFLYLCQYYTKTRLFLIPEFGESWEGFVCGICIKRARVEDIRHLGVLLIDKDNRKCGYWSGEAYTNVGITAGYVRDDFILTSICGHNIKAGNNSLQSQTHKGRIWFLIQGGRAYSSLSSFRRLIWQCLTKLLSCGQRQRDRVSNPTGRTL